MISFPRTAFFNQEITEKILKTVFSDKPELKNLFENQVKSVFWDYKLTADTLSVSPGQEVKEIEVLKLYLNQRKIDERLITRLNKRIPYHLLLVAVYQNQLRVWLKANNTCSESEQFNLSHAAWVPEEYIDLQIVGQNMDEVWQSFYAQVGDISPASEIQRAENLDEIERREPALKSLIIQARQVQRLSQTDLAALLSSSVSVKEKQEKIFNAYLGMALSMALRYCKCFQIDIGDCVSFALCGLVKAIEKYNIEENGYFSGYVSSYILRELERMGKAALQLIHIPVHIEEDLAKLKKVEKKFRIIFGREPSLEEYSKNLRWSVNKIKAFLLLMQEPISLSTSVDDEDEDTVEDLIKAKNIPDPLAAVKKVLCKDAVTEILATLSEREAKVISLRFGLESGYPRTLEEVGGILNITRERVRQVENKALRKLRCHIRLKTLKDYQD